MCERTGQMQLGHECTAQVGLLLDQMQSPHAAVQEVQKEEHYIASGRQHHALLHTWRDTVQNDWMDHLYCHLYITAVHHIIHLTR